MIPKIRKRSSGAYSVWDAGQELPQIFATAQVAIDYLSDKYPGGVTVEMYCGHPYEVEPTEIQHAVEGLKQLYTEVHHSRGHTCGLNFAVMSTTLDQINEWLGKNGYHLEATKAHMANNFRLQQR